MFENIVNGIDIAESIERFVFVGNIKGGTVIDRCSKDRQDRKSVV